MSLKKVLIVDDSISESRLMQSVLEKAGYWPVALNDPMRLEQMIEMEHPALILMDVVMPERNGFQACRDLKNHEEFSRIPIVFVTSKDTPSDRFWAERQGGDGFIGKPFTAQQLVSEVQKYL